MLIPARVAPLGRATRPVAPETPGQESMDVLNSSEPMLDVVTIARGPLTETGITVRALPGEPPSGLFGRLADALDRRGAEVLKMDVFGSCAAWDEGIRAIGRAWSEPTWPVTWIEGGSCVGTALAGVQVQAVAGAPVDTVRVDTRAVARVFQDEHARYAYFGDILPSDPSCPPPDQARQVFEALEAALQSTGMDLSHLVRTWLFNDRILDWYDGFNAVRTRFYAERGVLDGLVPASTGIGGRNPAGAALVAGALAFQPLGNAAHARAVHSPLQCPAPAYGSTFNRAVELVTPDHRRVLVSGTASIAPGGKTVHVGDVDGQIALTMQVVGAILDSCRMSCADVTRAVAYLKHADAAPALDAYVSDHPPAMPLVITRADICRDDLLFEVELDAVVGS